MHTIFSYIAQDLYEILRKCKDKVKASDFQDDNGSGDFTIKEQKCTLWDNRNFVSHYLWCILDCIRQCSTELSVLHANYASININF